MNIKNVGWLVAIVLFALVCALLIVVNSRPEVEYVDKIEYVDRVEIRLVSDTVTKTVYPIQVEYVERTECVERLRIVEVPTTYTRTVYVEKIVYVEVPAALPTPIPTPEPVVVPTAAPQPTEVPQAVCDCSHNRYNCKDFPTHIAAQECYKYCISQGQGDVHGLDGDSDGSACEWNP